MTIRLMCTKNTWENSKGPARWRAGNDQQLPLHVQRLENQGALEADSQPTAPVRRTYPYRTGSPGQMSCRSRSFCLSETLVLSGKCHKQECYTSTTRPIKCVLFGEILERAYLGTLKLHHYSLTAKKYWKCRRITYGGACSSCTLHYYRWDIRTSQRRLIKLPKPCYLYAVSGAAGCQHEDADIPRLPGQQPVGTCGASAYILGTAPTRFV